MGKPIALGALRLLACLALRASAALFIVMMAGCATCPPACDRDCISAQLIERGGDALGPHVCTAEIVLPSGAALEDGLTEEEAVVIALWNNAAFQELLTDLDIAYGDLVQAGLLPNPEVVYFFPVSDKPFKYAFEFPLEALWLRPIRIAAAERESDRVCQTLTQAALDLIRNLRQAYADVLLAESRYEIAKQAVALRTKIAWHAKVRLDAGDASPQEAATARIDALLADQELIRAAYDVEFAQHRLRNVLGVDATVVPLVLQADEPVRAELRDSAGLVAEAMDSRPDSLATLEAIAAAEERLRLAEKSWFRFLGILDATSGRRTGHEFGPAFRATIPLFHMNEGIVLRAEAELERATRQRQTVRDRIMLEVMQAHARYAQANAEWGVLADKVLPEVEAATGRAEAAYREGDTPYVVVLETTRQLLDSRLRAAQLEADLRRQWAELERSVGRRLQSPRLTEELPVTTPANDP